MSTSELFEAFEADTSDTKAFEALVKHLISDDDQSTLATVYEQLPSWAPGDAQNPLMRVLSQQGRVSKGKPIACFLHYQNGLALWQHYDSAQMAEMSFRKVENPPDDPSKLREFYLDYYVAQNNWRRLEQFMADPSKGGLEDQIEVKRMLARLAKQHKQPEKAIGFWQGVRTANPTDREAESNLRDLYVEVGKWHALVDLIKDNLASLGPDDADLQLQFQLELVDIYKNKMNAASKVVSAWQAILELDAGNPQALDALAGEFEEMKRWPDLVKILQLKVDHEDDSDKLIAMHERIASIMLERFSNTTEAIKSYEAILELDPDNGRAIEILKGIYEQRRDWDNYILVSEREINLLGDGDDKREQFVALARLASERIRRPAAPIALWERVLNGDPQSLEALAELEGLYEREKDYKSLAQIIEKRVAIEPDAAKQIVLLEKLGMVASVRLSDAEQAADVWRQLLDRDPTHRKAQSELKKKYLAERDWEGLEWFFRSFGDTSDWVRTLESQAKSLESVEDKTELLFKAAAIWKDELNETRRAVKNLEAVLALTPQHDDAARMLIPIYEELGNHKALPNVYDIVLEASEDAHERREMHLALAKIQEAHLKNPEAAFFAYVQAVSETPGAVDLHPELRRLAESSENWESYVFVLQESVEQIADDTDRIEVLLEIGRVYRDQLAAEDTALSFFNRVLAIDEYNKSALVASERAYAQTGAWDQLVLIYEKQLVIINAPDERRDVLFKLAGVWRNDVGANDESEAILREMLGDFPNETSVHDALIQIYLAEDRFAPLREVLEHKRDVLQEGNTPAPVLADIECELGMLTFGTRDKGAGIRDVVDHYSAALEYDPSHEATVTRLEELLADAGQRVRITRILEPVFENRMAWAPLAQMLEIQLLAAVEDDEREVQIELLTRVSGLYSERLDDHERAWLSYGRLFALQPERADVRGDFQRLTGALDRWAKLVDLYRKNADEPLDKASRIAIKLEVARAQHKRLDALEDARVFYHKVLDEEPEHKEALDALEGLYVDLDRAEDLLGIYRRKIELSDDIEQKLDYLFRTSDLLRDRIDNPEDAIAAAREALDLKPGHVPAVQRLDELYTVTGQWSELARTLEETVSLIGDEDAERKAVLEVRLAGVHEKHLDDPQSAIEIYARILQTAPGNMAAVEALETLFENEDLASSIAPILEPHYDNIGDWERLVDVYRVREASSDDLQEKVAWNYKMAELYELLGELPASAFRHYAAAASLDPASEKTLGELLRLSDSLGIHAELIEFLQEIVEEILDDRRRIETHRVIARLAAEKTQDIEGAETQLRAILELDPGDAEATDTLMALYEKADNSARLVDMLLLKAPMVHDPTEKHALY
ncbi:MAG: tetratricopeptide (TPR) repeat protein, partial [Myxococcota bacterium]